MSYGLKYWFQFDDIHPITKATWKVDISFKDYTGASTEITDLGATPLTFIRGTQSDDKFEPILGSEADMTIVITDESVLKPSDFIDIDEDEALVEIYKNTVLYWKGFIKQDFIEYAYTSTPYELTIPATDRIALMKSTLLDIQDEINGDGFVSLAKLLTSEGLYKTDLCSTLKMLSSLVHPTPDGMTYPDTGGKQLSFLDQLKIRYEVLIDDTGNPLNVYDALIMLARSFGARIFYSGGYYHFQRINDLYTEKPLVAVYTDQEYPDSRAAVAIRKTLKGEVSSSDGVYANNDAHIQIEGAHKQDKLDLDYVQRGYLNNYSWASFSGGQFADWYAYQINEDGFPVAFWTGISQKGTGTTEDPYMCFFAPNTSKTQFICQVSEVTPPQVYSLSFKLKFFQSQRMAYQILLYLDTSINQDAETSVGNLYWYDGLVWQGIVNEYEPGNSKFHIMVERPSDIKKNEVDVNVTFPPLPPYIDSGAIHNYHLLVLFVDPDGTVDDGASDKGIEIGLVQLSTRPYNYTGETDTMRNTGNYSILNEDDDIKIIDGYDAFANSIHYGTYGVNNGGTIGSWSDDYLKLGVSESHLMTLRGIAEQNRKQCKKLTTSMFSNTLEFENVIQQAFGDSPLMLQMYDEYDVKSCIHQLQLLEVIDSTGAKAVSKQTYKTP